jgi:RND family efflux transporter MFP subunit
MVIRLRERMLSVVGIAFLIAVILPGCKERIKPGQVQVKRPEIMGVTMAKIASSTVDSHYETSGTVRAWRTSTLASRVFGTVTAVSVKEGDAVRAGDILLTIDDRDTRERVNAAESGYKEALKAREAAEKQSALGDITSRRYGNLYKEKVVSQQEFDQIETQRNVANLELERASLASERARALLGEARIHLSFTRVRAPFSGVVTAKKVEQGSMAVPGMPLITVEDASRFTIAANVDEKVSGKLRLGARIRVYFDTAGRTVTAAITKIVPAVDPATRTFAIEAELPETSLKSGLYGKVLIPEGTREAILVPPSAIVVKGQLTGVYGVDEGGVVTYRLIRKGRTHSGGTEILSGLKNGDKIIVSGVEKAVDGGMVKDR